MEKRGKGGIFTVLVGGGVLLLKKRGGAKIFNFGQIYAPVAVGKEIK